MLYAVFQQLNPRWKTLFGKVECFCIESNNGVCIAQWSQGRYFNIPNVVSLLSLGTGSQPSHIHRQAIVGHFVVFLWPAEEPWQIREALHNYWLVPVRAVSFCWSDCIDQTPVMFWRALKASLQFTHYHSSLKVLISRLLRSTGT